MEEQKVLLALDFAADVVGVLSQPFRLRYRAAGKMLNHTYTAQSNIHWSEDFQTLFFKGRPIEIRKL